MDCCHLCAHLPQDAPCLLWDDLPALSGLFHCVRVEETVSSGVFRVVPCVLVERVVWSFFIERDFS